MSKNPWLSIRLEDYKNHMSHPNVFQLQTLNHITKGQLETFMNEQHASTVVAVLGIANGNGLEHCLQWNIENIIGIDINPDYLLACKQCYAHLLPNLQLFCLDLIGDWAEAVNLLKDTDLLIANLLIEHIHLANFTRLISAIKKPAQMVSCVIQHNPDGGTVSQSGHEKAFDQLAPLIQESGSKAIIDAMLDLGFTSTLSQSFQLPNGKSLILLDFHYSA